MKELRIIEATLFSAGAPVAVEDIKEATEISEKIIKNALKELIDEYKKRDSALEIAKVGEKYAMQLRSEFAGHVRKIAEMEIPIKVLKTAALIAYHQPLKQSDLRDMIGYRIYDDVKILSELGLIRRRDSVRTKIITTSERFSEYFGIDSTDREDIKKWLMEKLNIMMPEKVKEILENAAKNKEESAKEENEEEESGVEEQQLPEPGGDEEEGADAASAEVGDADKNTESGE